ncbi:MULTISPECIES: ABC transporter substrate-binding protein [Pandoraea]|uniref:Putative aliphatic sulfonates-binding protein n=1 Tax=Pandoraea communis TaxID=2508297 RepID=A0A5E4YQQ7_9BURK|nr:MULTISPECIES: ABC transporter substrate-binding protein [Pandoraea]EON14088.1 nitrate ABC transporter, periplasmic nitrate-binding protein [Pandoraea sp. SD6-2]VVE51224.1 nitrate ABC transporter, periplasmic nitrate-binding protein [Pandoraea communis]
MKRTFRFAAALTAITALLSGSAYAETIRIAIGTQDTTINTATGGALIRELKLLDRYLPHDGRYKDAVYDIQWKNFTSGAPITNEMIAGKLDFGSMADFPGVLNGVANQKAGRGSIFINVLSGSVQGSGNGIVVPADSVVQSIADLKGKTISVPFASTAHGMLLRAVAAQGWSPDRDVNIITQAPEVAGPALQSRKIDAHADFVPFAELFPYRGFARKIYDGSQGGSATFHGTLVETAYAQKYPEIVVAYLRAVIEANRLIAAEPEKYSELIAKVTGIEPEVDYLFHGPLGLQTRDLTWKPEYRKALQTSFDTLKLLGRTDGDLDVAHFIDDRYLRAAFKADKLDYDAALKNYAQTPLKANDAITGKPIVKFERVAQIWVRGEPTLRSYAAPEEALSELVKLREQGKEIRVFYAQDRETGIKLLGNQAWFAREPDGRLSAFLLKQRAQTWAQAHGAKVFDFANALQPAALATR